MQYLAERPSRVDGGLLDIPRSVDELFNRFWGGLTSNARTQQAWRPAIDILETPQAYVMHAEIPGINPDDIDVTLAGETVTIRGEKQLPEKLDDQTWYMSERIPGHFERCFTLPAAVSADDIEAEAHNGVLTVKVMKAQEAQPHRIKVRRS